jgi:hypothetical protein
MNWFNLTQQSLYDTVERVNKSCEESKKSKNEPAEHKDNIKFAKCEYDRKHKINKNIKNGMSGMLIGLVLIFLFKIIKGILK